MPPRNTIDVARACLTGLAGLALVILPASLAEATFGPRTKIGTNYQQTSTTRSLDGKTEGSCNGSSGCFVLFQLPPAQKPLIVQHVSCRVAVSAGGLIHGILRTRKGQDLPLSITYLVPVPTTGTWWVVSSPVMHLVESGQRPLVFLSNSTGADWIAECTISGRLQ